MAGRSEARPPQPSAVDRRADAASSDGLFFSSDGDGSRTVAAEATVGAAVTIQQSVRSSVDGLVFEHPEDRELLRCTRTGEVMRSMGAVLRSSACSDKHGGFGGRSQQADNVGTFISHNWSVSRFDKMLVLLVHVNGWPAMAVAMLMSSLCFFAVVAGWLPTFDVVQAGRIDSLGRFVEASCWCLISHLVFYVVSLTCLHEVARISGYDGPRCFLDKCCVNQVNESEKRRAINSLAAFVYYSQDFLVVYTDVYLTRLWTVYEMATFLLLRPRGRALIRPTIMIKWLLLSTSVIYVQFLAFFVTRLRMVRQHGDVGSSVDPSLLLAKIVSAMIILPVTYMWAREESKMMAQIEIFSVAGAQCFVEADRDLVSNNIVKFMKDLEYVPLETSREGAILAFESIVRSQLPVHLTSSSGWASAPYDVVILASGAAWGFLLDILAEDLMGGGNVWRSTLSRLLQFAEMSLCNIPLCLVLSLYLGRRAHALRASFCRGVWFWPLACVAFAVFSTAISALGVLLATMATYEHPLWLAAQSGVLGAELLVVWFFFRTPKPHDRHSPHLERSGPPSHTGERRQEKGGDEPGSAVSSESSDSKWPPGPPRATRGQRRDEPGSAVSSESSDSKWPPGPPQATLQSPASTRRPPEPAPPAPPLAFQLSAAAPAGSADFRAGGDVHHFPLGQGQHAVKWEFIN